MLGKCWLSSRQAERMKRWKWPFCSFDHGGFSLFTAAAEIGIISFDLDTLFSSLSKWCFIVCADLFEWQHSCYIHLRSSLWAESSSTGLSIWVKRVVVRIVVLHKKSTYQITTSFKRLMSWANPMFQCIEPTTTFTQTRITISLCIFPTSIWH